MDEVFETFKSFDICFGGKLGDYDSYRHWFPTVGIPVGPVYVVFGKFINSWLSQKYLICKLVHNINLTNNYDPTQTNKNYTKLEWAKAAKIFL